MKRCRSSEVLSEGSEEDSGYDDEGEDLPLPSRTTSNPTAPPTTTLPPSTKPTLYPFQQKGVEFLIERDKRRGGILADQQGLGKTVQVAAFLSHLFSLCKTTETRRKESTLILVPTSVLHQWQQELSRFGITATLFYGSGRNFSKLINQYEQSSSANPLVHPLVVLTTHATMQQSTGGEGEKTLFTWDWRRVIIDEAHEFRELKRKRSKALEKIHRETTILLTGTPVLNRIVEFLSLMFHITRNEKFKGLKQSPEAIRIVYTLKEAGYVLRRTKQDVSYNGVGALILPNLSHMTREVRFQQKEKDVYMKLWSNFIMRMRNFLHGSDEISAVHILAAITKLRLFCVHPLLSFNEKGECQKHMLDAYLHPKPGEPEPGILPISGKISHIMKDLRVILEQRGTNKVLIFSQWTSVLDIIAYYLKRFNGIYGKYVRLDGKTSHGQRKALVEQFQTIPDIRVFLISTKAGGIGLNLTAANHVMITDLCWNPGTEEQAIDRAHRCGQKSDVTVYRYVLKDVDSIEECMLQLQQGKQEHVDVICGTDQKKLKLPELRLFLAYVNRLEKQKEAYRRQKEAQQKRRK